MINLVQTKHRLRQELSWDYDDANSHKPGWNGTFDNKVSLTNGQNEAGAIFVGQLYIADNNQPMRVIFDTGSDYLAVTSDLCGSTQFGPKFKN